MYRGKAQNIFLIDRLPYLNHSFQLVANSIFTFTHKIWSEIFENTERFLEIPAFIKMEQRLEAVLRLKN